VFACATGFGPAREEEMLKAALLAVALTASTLPAFAGNGQGQDSNNQGGGLHGAPAPLIGGLPVALVVGGAWVARKLWKRKKRA
jgi:hypothetical protein